MTTVLNSELLGLSRSFVEQYEHVYACLFQAYDLRLSKHLGLDQSDFTAKMQIEFVGELGKLTNDSFEPFLKNHHPDKLKYLHDILKKVHSISVDLNPNHFCLRLDNISDDRQFELAILRVIAGAASVALDPESFIHDGMEAGALKYTKPNAQVQKKMQAAIDEMKKQGLELPHQFEIKLKLLANGIPLISQYDLSGKNLELMVREITLISNLFFTINTSGKNRFPAKAIMTIAEIINFKVPSERTIQSIQESVEDEVAHGSPLSLDFLDRLSS